MGRRTDIERILYDELWVDVDGNLQGVEEASRKLDEFVDEKIIEEKELELMYGD